MTVASSDAVSIRHLGKVPRPTAIAVMGRVWSVRVAKGVGGSIGVAFISLCHVKSARRTEQREKEKNEPTKRPNADSCVFSSTDEGRIVV